MNVFRNQYSNKIEHIFLGYLCSLVHKGEKLHKLCIGGNFYHVATTNNGLWINAIENNAVALVDLSPQALQHVKEIEEEEYKEALKLRPEQIVERALQKQRLTASSDIFVNGKLEFVTESDGYHSEWILASDYSITDGFQTIYLPYFQEVCNKDYVFDFEDVIESYKTIPMCPTGTQDRALEALAHLTLLKNQPYFYTEKTKARFFVSLNGKVQREKTNLGFENEEKAEQFLKAYKIEIDHASNL